MECLVTKLKSVVEDENLPYFNKVIIKAEDLINRYPTLATLELGTYVSNYPSTSKGDVTYKKIIPVYIGETLSFSKLSSVFNNIEDVENNNLNIRIIVFDNTTGRTEFGTENISRLCSTICYNYGNKTKRTITIDDNEYTRAASNLCAAIAFMSPNVTEPATGTGKIIINLHY